MGKRDSEILNILADQKRVEVARLSEMVNAAQSTIRRDLDDLEAKGLVKREHGCAILGSEDNIGNRLAIHYDLKRRIAEKAAELVREGELVMIESGSCCALLADEMAARKNGVKIVTNSAFIASYIRKYAWAKTILLGGDYQNEAQVMVGPITRQTASTIFADKLFIGTDGFSEQTGFTGNDHLRVEAVHDMARQVKNVIILTESLKFRQRGVFPLLPIDRINILVTDEGIPPDTERYFSGQGVRVIKAASPPKTPVGFLEAF